MCTLQWASQWVAKVSQSDCVHSQKSSERHNGWQFMYVCCKVWCSEGDWWRHHGWWELWQHMQSCQREAHDFLALEKVVRNILDPHCKLDHAWVAKVSQNCHHPARVTLSSWVIVLNDPDWFNSLLSRTGPPILTGSLLSRTGPPILTGSLLSRTGPPILTGSLLSRTGPPILTGSLLSRTGPPMLLTG